MCATAPQEKRKTDLWKEATASAFRGGTSGAIAMVANVVILMWMRTTNNYQCRHGTSFPTALRTLYGDGGIPRFYRGLLPALIHGPISRFGDTASNSGVMILNSSQETKDLNVGVKTAAASTSAALFRIVLMPIDTVKTTMQVTGKISFVEDSVKRVGFRCLYNGWIAASMATFAGHYPWFVTYNFLSEQIPKQDSQMAELGRRAVMGFCSSAVSDTCSNSIRVVKVYKQTYAQQLSYVQVVRNVIQETGVTGLMCRGLGTKILANGLQGILFSILWKHFEEVDVIFGKKN